MDFRPEAAEATLKKLNHPPGTALAELGESGCIPIPGGRRAHCAVELPTVFISTICMLSALLALPVTWAGVLPSRLTYPILLVGLGIALVLRQIKSLILKAYFSSRSDSLLKSFAHLPAKAVGLEDGKTHKKTKLVPEDEGICLLDSDRRRLLIEGCSYRYVICAKDVSSVAPVSGYGLSGALVNCRMAGREIDVALTSAGQGPLASLTQAFAPGAGAKGLASSLNRTLFGTDAATHKPGVPPPLPGGIGAG